MKKTIFLLVLLLLAVMSPFAQSRKIYIEGIAPRSDQRTFFIDNFRTEAGSAGHIPVNSRGEADYTLRFEVKPNVIVYEDGTSEPAPRGEPQFVIAIFFDMGNTELVSFEFPFTELDEMYDYTQYLFLKAAVLIPPPILPEGFVTFDELVAAAEGGGSGTPRRPGAPAAEGAEWVMINNEWYNKWVYVRTSFDFPITFYKLNDDQLIGGVGMTNEDRQTRPLDNRVIALPGFTIGAEIQFLDFLSAEVNFQGSWEHLNDKDFVFLAAGLQIKLPIKLIKNMVLEPYAAVKYPVFLKDSSIDLFSTSEIFTEFPMFGFGGGLQASVRAGKLGAVFIDVNYMFFGDTTIKNPYADLYTDMPEIQYQRYVIGLAIGYKFGFINRKPKAVKADTVKTDG